MALAGLGAYIEHRPSKQVGLTEAAAGAQVLPSLVSIAFRSVLMTWETPAAIDLRFGFEITMYIANR